MFTYFTWYKGSSKAILEGQGVTLLNIRKVIEKGNSYMGGYKALDGQVVLEDIIAYDEDFFESTNTFRKVAQYEESVYKCKVINKVKIGSILDKKYLIATLYDLMESLTEPLQGFTVYKDIENNYYLLICSQGEYIMNPNYNKEKQDAIK